MATPPVCVLSVLSDHLMQAVRVPTPYSLEKELQVDGATSRNDAVVDFFARGSLELIEAFTANPAQLFTVLDERVVPTASGAAAESFREESLLVVRQKLKELAALVSVLQRPAEMYDLLYAYELFIPCLSKWGVWTELVSGLEQSLMLCSTERCVDLYAEEQLILLYTEALFWLTKHHADLRRNKESFLHNAEISFPWSVDLMRRLHQLLCDFSCGAESFYQRAALLLAGVLCVAQETVSPLQQTTTSSLLPLLYPLHEKMLSHFSTHDPSHVSHLAALALLQHAPLPLRCTSDDEVLQLWSKMFPVLSQGRMYDPDFSCIVEHDGTRSALLEEVKRTLSTTLGIVWSHIHSSTFWNSFSFDALHSACRGSQALSFAWGDHQPVGIHFLVEHVQQLLNVECANKVAGTHSTPGVADTVLSHLTLLGYLSAIMAEKSVRHSVELLSLSLERLDTGGNANPSLRTAAVASLFPVPHLISSGNVVQLLPQYFQHLNWLVSSPHFPHIASRAGLHKPSIDFFYSSATLLCSLLSAVEESRVAELEELAMIHLKGLLFSVFHALSRMDHPDSFLQGQVYTCLNRFYFALDQPALVYSVMLSPTSLEKLGQTSSSISTAVLETHLYAILSSKEKNTAVSPLSFPSRLLVCLGALQQGVLTRHVSSLTFFLTVVHYVHNALTLGAVSISREGAAILEAAPNILSALMEGAAILMNRVETGFVDAVEASVHDALHHTLHLVAGLMSASRAFRNIVTLSVPVGSVVTPCITLLLQMLFSNHFSFRSQHIAAQLWCSSIQSASNEMFHAFRVSLRASSRSRFSEKIMQLIRSEVGQPSNILRLEVLYAAQRYDRRLFMHLVTPQMASGESQLKDLHDLRIVKVLCEIVSNKESTFQEVGLSLHLIRGIGLTDALQTSLVAGKLQHPSDEHHPSYLCAYLCSAAADYVNALFNEKKASEGNAPGSSASPPSNPVSSRVNGSLSRGSTPQRSVTTWRKRRSSLPVIALPTSNPFVSLLQTVLESGSTQLGRAVRDAREALQAIEAPRWDSNEEPPQEEATESAGWRAPWILGPSFSFSTAADADSLNIVRSLLYSIAQLCSALERTVLLYAEEVIGTPDAGLKKIREILQAALECTQILTAMGSPELAWTQQRCLAECLSLSKSIASVEEAHHLWTNTTEDLSPSLVNALEYLGTVFLSSNAQSLRVAADVVGILRPFFCTKLSDSVVLEHIFVVLGERMVRAVGTTTSQQDVPCALVNSEPQSRIWDRFMEECHLLILRQEEMGFSAAALHRLCTSITHHLDQLGTRVVVKEAPDVWTERLVACLQFLQSLIHRFPQTLGWISKTSIVSLGSALGSLMAMPTLTSSVPGMSSRIQYQPCAAHVVWCAVLELLSTLLSRGGKCGAFSVTSTGWQDVVLPICLTPRFLYALSAFSQRSAGQTQTAPLFVWDVFECYLCTQIVAISSALGIFVDRMLPPVVGAFREVHFSRLINHCTPSTVGDEHVEASEHESLQWYKSHLVRDQLSFLMVQPPFLLCLELFSGEISALKEDEGSNPRLSFSLLSTFIIRQLRGVQRALKGGATVADPFLAYSAGSRSPSVETATSFVESDDPSSKTDGTRVLSELQADILPVHVESVELALTLFVRGAKAVVQYTQDNHVGSIDAVVSELRSTGERLEFTLKGIEKGLDDAATILSFVKSRRRQIHHMISLLQE